MASINTNVPPLLYRSTDVWPNGQALVGHTLLAYDTGAYYFLEPDGITWAPYNPLGTTTSTPTAFLPSGNSQLASISGSVTTLTLNSALSTVRIINLSSATVHFALGGSVSLPVIGTPGSGIAVGANSAETFATNGATSISFIAGSSGNLVEIVQGTGA